MSKVIVKEYQENIKNLLNELNFVINESEHISSADKVKMDVLPEVLSLNKSLVMKMLQDMGVSSDKVKQLFQIENFSFQALGEGKYNSHEAMQDFKVLSLMLDPKFLSIISGYAASSLKNNTFNKYKLNSLKEWKEKLNNLNKQKEDKVKELDGLKQFLNLIDSKEEEVLKSVTSNFSKIIKEGTLYFDKLDVLETGLAELLNQAQNKGLKVVENLINSLIKDSNKQLVEVMQWEDKLNDFLKINSFNSFQIKEINKLTEANAEEILLPLNFEIELNKLITAASLRKKDLQSLTAEAIGVLNAVDPAKQGQLLREISYNLMKNKNESSFHSEEMKKVIKNFKEEVESKLKSEFINPENKIKNVKQAKELIEQEIISRESEIDEITKDTYKELDNHFDTKGIGNEDNILTLVKSYIFEVKLEKNNTIAEKLTNQNYVSQLIDSETKLKAKIIEKISKLSAKQNDNKNISNTTLEEELKTKEEVIKQLSSWNTKLKGDEIFKKVAGILENNKLNLEENANEVLFQKQIEEISNKYSNHDFFAYGERIQDKLFSKQGEWHTFFNSGFYPFNSIGDSINTGLTILKGILTGEAFTELLSGKKFSKGMPWSKKVSGNIDAVLMKELDAIKEKCFEKLNNLITKQGFINTDREDAITIKLNHDKLTAFSKTFEFQPVMLGKKSTEIINDFDAYEAKHIHPILKFNFADKIKAKIKNHINIFEEGTQEQISIIEKNIEASANNAKASIILKINKLFSEMMGVIIDKQLHQINEALKQDISNELKAFKLEAINRLYYYLPADESIDPKNLQRTLEKVMKEVFEYQAELLKNLPNKYIKIIDEKFAQFLSDALEKISPAIMEFIDKQGRQIIDEYETEFSSININLIEEAKEFFGIKVDRNGNEYIEQESLLYKVKELFGIKHQYENLKNSRTLIEESTEYHIKLLFKDMIFNSAELNKKLNDIEYLEKLDLNMLDEKDKEFVSNLKFMKHAEKMHKIYEKLEILEKQSNQENDNNFNLEKAPNLRDLLDHSDWWNLKQYSAVFVDNAYDTINNYYKFYFDTSFDNIKAAQDDIVQYINSFHNIIEIAKVKIFVNLVEAKKQSNLCTLTKINQPIDCNKNYESSLKQFINLFPQYKKDSSLIKDKIFELSYEEAKLFYSYRIPVPEIKDKQIWEQVYEEYINLAEHVTHDFSN
ncbi:hypothetical protein NF27_DP01170 [Candidatus Jidaibacter acanthamoeba]|uniref:Uncharacterized protein n=1 Tax=Candidatus Jidaibacter acanthamoebae TaxID=86105 RepID=A0A0C1QNG4_9RICK|nr:hypothetical protein [Candidatus Jidaibacter acanthamoeba]KIE05573.1 hypothetical protein NF27_DP01170 [Candidatus Jidaibacter acanthamoeba]